jgi:hypothetical protein
MTSVSGFTSPTWLISSNIYEKLDTAAISRDLSLCGTDEAESNDCQLVNFHVISWVFHEFVEHSRAEPVDRNLFLDVGSEPFA